MAIHSKKKKKKKIILIISYKKVQNWKFENDASPFPDSNTPQLKYNTSTTLHTQKNKYSLSNNT